MTDDVDAALELLLENSWVGDQYEGCVDNPEVARWVRESLKIIDRYFAEHSTWGENSPAHVVRMLGMHERPLRDEVEFWVALALDYEDEPAG